VVFRDGLEMATRTLLDKIDALLPEKQAEVEDFVEFLGSRTVRRTVKGTIPDSSAREE